MPAPLTILGIESSCDDTAAAVLRADGAVSLLSSVVSSQTDLHEAYGGVVPEIAARDHLAALGEIQDALARSDFDAAGRLAEQRLGMSSLTAHGAHDVAPFMPAGMQTMGTDMHHAASQFAVAAQDAAVTGDLGRALAALARVNRTCVACHAAYRLE